MRIEYLPLEPYNTIGDHNVKEILTSFNFDVFVQYLQERILKENQPSKKEYLQGVEIEFQQKISGLDPMTPANITDFLELFGHIKRFLLPPVAEENAVLWGISSPWGQEIYAGTDPLYSLLQSNKSKLKLVTSRIESGVTIEVNNCIHAAILSKFYDLPECPNYELIFSYPDETSGLSKYIQLNVDNRFMDIKVNGELPSLDLLDYRLDLSKLLNGVLLTEVLPLGLFTFCGFSIVSIKDVTAVYVLDDIKNNILNSDSESLYDKVVHSLKILAGGNGVEFSLLPFLKLNNKIVFDRQNLHESVLLNIVQSKKIWMENLDAFIEDYKSDPKLIVMEAGSPSYPIQYNFLFEGLSRLKLAYYALVPVFHNTDVVGVLEIYSETLKKLDRGNITNVIAATPLLAQLLKDASNKFEKEINRVIREKFTSLQPSVQWKFNEVAMAYLQNNRPNNPKPVMETIQFDHVFPLYGAIDIRNSTIERNLASTLDMEIQLHLLIEVVEELREWVRSEKLENIISTCYELLGEIKKVPMDEIQVKISDYMDYEVKNILKLFKEQGKESHVIIQRYEEAIIPATGVAFTNRRALEISITKINTAVNTYLELFNEEIQSNYPCYFEKFRTDGIEYDIYIGQSIAPEKKFNEIYLDNIRLWQLTSMASITKLTHHLIPQMERPLAITQLIFVASTPIDIVFRTDEKRFDVEGAYNIRYYIIKKRIDKVLIKDTNERLTQPGKICLVYINPKDIKAYGVYISYLQQKGMLLDDLEELELEELQGINGLKALRVGVNVDFEEEGEL